MPPLFDLLRIALVTAALILLVWTWIRIRRYDLATLHSGSTLAYIATQAFNLFRRRKPNPKNNEEEGGQGAVPALVGAGPRGPRTATDAQAWPEV